MSSQVVVVDSGIGNFGSVLNMLAKIGVPASRSDDPEIISRADKLLLPGVGAFAAGMKALRERNLIDVLNSRVIDARVPVLGICLGMQLLCEHSEEGDAPGLGWIKGNVVRFRFPDGAPAHKIPHMGWNHVAPARDTPLFAGLSDGARFYFAHSYHMQCAAAADALATCDYGMEFTAAVQRGNIFGVQFHPEKSHRYGMKLLKNFVELV